MYFFLLKVLYTTYNYVNIMYFSVTTLLSINVTYYRLKFVVRRDVNCTIFGNISHIDQLLESLHIKVPHLQNIIACILFLIVNLVLLATYVYESYYYVSFSSLRLDFTEMCNFLYFVAMNLAVSALTMYFFALLCVVSQRVRLTRRAVESFNKRSDRKDAWRGDVTVSVVLYSNTVNYLAALNHCYKSVIKMYRCVYETYGFLRQLCSTFSASICVVLSFGFLCKLLATQATRTRKAL